MTDKKKCCKKPITKPHTVQKEMDYMYVQDVVQFHCANNEIYLTVEYRDDDLKLQEKTIIFDAFNFLHSGACDKEYIKEKVIEHIKEI